MNAQAKVWLGSMPHFLLKLDHRKNRALAVLAKKVGINTILLWGAIRERRTLVRRIDRLLEDVGELPQPEARHCHWAGRTRDRFEDAMLLLQEAGIFGRVAWPEGSGPGDTDRNKGWLARWLATKITIYQNATQIADVAGEIVHRKSAKRRRKRSPDGATLRGNLIRSLRTSRSLTQGQLAKELGVSPAYLSHIENEKRLLSQAVLQRLLLWITAGNVGEPSRH
jgi:DNA-binding transcriptional regulator YiaG